MRRDMLHWTFRIALVCLMSAAPLLAADAAPPTLRVMSFNIRFGTANDGPNHWERRKDLVAETIRAFDPDLLGTQETLGFQRDFLAAQLPGYESAGVGRDDGKQQGEMMAVFYRKSRFERLAVGHFWLSQTPDVIGSKSWDSSLPRMCTWLKLRDRQAAGKTVWFFNTHFDHQGPESRLQAARLLRSRIADMTGDESWILTGDFNTAEGTPPYVALFGADKNLPLAPRDVYRIAHPQPGPEEKTFSGFQAAPAEGARIDWIACSTDLEVLSAEIDRTAREGRTPSDHFPVTAVLRRATGGGQ